MVYCLNCIMALLSRLFWASTWEVAYWNSNFIESLLKLKFKLDQLASKLSLVWLLSQSVALGPELAFLNFNFWSCTSMLKTPNDWDQLISQPEHVFLNFWSNLKLNLLGWLDGRSSCCQAVPANDELLPLPCKVQGWLEPRVLEWMHSMKFSFQCFDSKQ